MNDHAQDQAKVLAIRKTFRDILTARMGSFKDCALLDYPDHRNIGDHAVWAGECLALRRDLKINIRYVASLHDFSEARLKQDAGDAPIVFTGGGNVGDLWPEYQRFREQVIARYPDRPILIFPQSIFFTRPDNLRRAAEVFNAHPDLTLMVREEQSLAIAKEHFKNCKIILCPDAALMLAGLAAPVRSLSSRGLYLCRRDPESFLNAKSALPGFDAADWVTYGGPGGLRVRSDPDLPAVVRKLGEIALRRMVPVKEWLERETWKREQGLREILGPTSRASLSLHSFNLVHAGMYQLAKYRRVVTDRLHAHILCVLLGIPNVLLANRYPKNESFYHTWTRQIPFCRFAKEPREIRARLDELDGLDPLERGVRS
jgi:pyruvyl transferase EpsO